jgi:hypothetical protein
VKELTVEQLRKQIEPRLQRELREWRKAYKDAQAKGYNKRFEVFQKERLARHRNSRPIDGSFIHGHEYNDSADSNSDYDRNLSDVDENEDIWDGVEMNENKPYVETKKKKEKKHNGNLLDTWDDITESSSDEPTISQPYYGKDFDNDNNNYNNNNNYNEAINESIDINNNLNDNIDNAASNLLNGNELLHPPNTDLNPPILPSIHNFENINDAINETINENDNINENIEETVHNIEDNENTQFTEPHQATETIPSRITEPGDPPTPPPQQVPPIPPPSRHRSLFTHRTRRNHRDRDNDPPYPNIHNEPWYDKPSNDSLRNIIINRQRGITYHRKLVTPQLAGEWLKKQNEKGFRQGWRIEYGDFDDDERTPDNVVIKDQDDDDRIIDGYEINDGNKKRYNQNLLRNYPHTSYVRKLPNFPLYKDFYDQPKPVIDRFHGKAHNWVNWRRQQPILKNDYISDKPLMINVFVRNALNGIVWKDEFGPRDYDPKLILPTYHALRNRLKLNYAELDRQNFFNKENRLQNVYNMFRNIYNDKLRQKKQRLHIFYD